MSSIDAPILADHERRRDGQERPAMALKLLKIDAESPVSLLDFVTHPEDEAERQGVGEIEVRQHLEG